jgi:hypothetical protein
MLNGEQPPSCLKCYKEEAAGHNSKRMWETAYWMDRVDLDQLIADTAPDGSIPPKLSYIDLRFGTKCQLACVMCSPHDSSGWIKDWQAIYPQIENSTLKQTAMWANKGSTNGSSYNWHKNNPVFWQQFYEQIPHMQQLYFAGGESLIIEEHYEILEECIRQGHAKNLELRYNSNGVEWREDLFDLWKHFKLVRFHYSVDSINEMNDYIRYPSKWSRTAEVFHILDTQTPSNTEVTVACAVQALNIYYIPDFIKWKLEQGFKKINMWPFGAGGVNYHFFAGRPLFIFGVSITSVGATIPGIYSSISPFSRGTRAASLSMAAMSPGFHSANRLVKIRKYGILNLGVIIIRQSDRHIPINQYPYWHRPRWN